MKTSKLAILCLLCLVTVFFTGCTTKKTNKTASQTPAFLRQDSQAVTGQTTSNLNLAKTKAKAWKADAYLAAYNLKIPQSLASTEAAETFVFGSPSDQTNWWTISLDKKGGYIRASIPKEDYLGQNLQPIDEKAWVKNYIEALQIAEKSGGSDFRTKNPESEISMVLAQTTPNNWLWWKLDYQAATTNMTILVSARDGQAYNESGTLINSSSKSKTK